MITIAEIAEILGVSSTTVSNVINGKTNQVSQKTVDRVNSALKKYNYTPNLSAVNLAKKNSKIIGMVLICEKGERDNYLLDPFTAEIIGAVEHSVRKIGFHLMLYISPDMEAIINWIKSWNMDGLIVLGLKDSTNKKLKANFSKPFVTIDSYLSDPNNYNVGFNDREGAYLMTKYLIESGHKDILFIADNQVGVDFYRYCGYKDALSESNLDEHFFKIPIVDEERSFSYDILSKMVDSYTAFLCASDFYCANIISALSDRGISVPQDISVTGFDDTYLAKIYRPRLTTIRQCVAKKGSEAVKMLTELIKDEIPKNKKINLKPELIIRDSSREV